MVLASGMSLALFCIQQKDQCNRLLRTTAVGTPSWVCPAPCRTHLTGNADINQTVQFEGKKKML